MFSRHCEPQAKQSKDDARLLDRFVASLLAMTRICASTTPADREATA